MRKPYYHKSADHIVDTSTKSVDEIVVEILHHLEDREILGRMV